MPISDFKNYSDISVIEPTGELGRREIAELCQTIDSLLQSDWVRIVLNLSQVTHLHYAAIGHLVNSLLHLRLADGDLKLAHLDPYNKKIFQFAGIHNYFETYDSLAEAVLSFERPLEG
ncbi:MAG: STAS domain-containing protein [Deltaproteobacteria bacterium]|nr:STAS domain-containing protein [Deltaproteobacteria bacterium]